MHETNQTTPQDFIAVVNGIQLGEESKGSTVEWLAKELKAHTIVRDGGCQAGHHVVTPDGRQQQFSQFSCGTFQGAHTHLHNMVIEPTLLFEEAMELEQKGVPDPLNIITIDGDCVSITPFHGALSRLKEIYRSEKKGTIGMGVGDAVKDSLNRPHLTVRARDFLGDKNQLHAKVESIRLAKLEEACQIVAASPFWWYLDGAEKEFNLLEDEAMVNTVVNSFQYLADLVSVTDDSFLDNLLDQPGSIVTEPSHGALLHPYAFAPHTTQIDPTSQELISTLKQKNSNKKMIRLGVGRCYHTRHGHGPLVSYDQNLTKNSTETHNASNAWANEWLGEFRVGHYDLIATRYALEIAGGQDSFDGQIISFLDKLAKHDSWGVVEAYTYTGNATNLEEYFEMQGEQIVGIKPHPDTRDQSHLDHQLKLTQLLKQCQPIVTYLHPTNTQSLETIFLKYVEEKTGIPVVAISRGPTAQDRHKLPAWDRVFNQPETKPALFDLATPIGTQIFLAGDQPTPLIPNELSSQPELQRQTQLRRELTQSLRQIFKLCDHNSVHQALESGNLNPTELTKLYSQLTQFLLSDPNNSRILLYLPFEILPDLSSNPTQPPQLHQAQSEFAQTYRNAWIQLLHESEPRANFVDGDILEPGLGIPPRVRKAAHFLPELLRRSLLDLSTISDIMTTSTDPELLTSLTEGLTSAFNQGLIPESDWGALQPFCQTPIPTPLPNSDSISPMRLKWLHQLQQEKSLDQSAQTIAQKLLSAQVTPQEVVSSNPDVAQIRGIITAAETALFTNPKLAQNISDQTLSHLLQAWQTDSQPIRDELTSGLNRWHKLDLVSSETLTANHIPIIDLSQPVPDIHLTHQETLAQACQAISRHPELSQHLYPFILAFGSQVKGYATSSSDSDLAVIFKPNTPTEKREHLLKIVRQYLPHLDSTDKILEFWTETHDNHITFKAPDPNLHTMVGAPQIHFIFGSAIIGDLPAARKLYTDILPKYFNLSRFGDQQDQVRSHLLRQLELDILQYRLMHKGYRRFHPLVPRPDFPNSDSIDWHSDFWDPGYRRTATHLFLSRVFLPNQTII